MVNHYISIICLVVWNMVFIFHFIFIYGMSSFPLTNSIIFQDVFLTTNQINYHPNFMWFTEWFTRLYIYGLWFGTFFVFPYIGKNHPSWLSYFSEGWLNHQLDMIYMIWHDMISTDIPSFWRFQPPTNPFFLRSRRRGTSPWSLQGPRWGEENGRENGWKSHGKWGNRWMKSCKIHQDSMKNTMKKSHEKCINIPPTSRFS